jgi:hypothetical protein
MRGDRGGWPAQTAMPRDPIRELRHVFGMACFTSFVLRLWPTIAVVVVAILITAAVHDRRARRRGHVLRSDAAAVVRRTRRHIWDAQRRDPFDRNLRRGYTPPDP